MDDLQRRLEAVERAVVDGDMDVASLADAAETEERLSALEDRAAIVDERLLELEAAVQAVEGYVGGVEAINETVERGVAHAHARLDRLETSDRGSGSGPIDDAADTARAAFDTPDDAAEAARAAFDASDDATDSSSDRSTAERLRELL